MTQKATHIGIGIVIAAIIVVAFAFSYVAKANPVYFLQNPSASATSSLSFMTPGLGTTTTSYDLGAGGAQGADSSVALVCLSASTTATILNISVEYSYDNQTWFDNNLAATTTVAATIGSIVTPNTLSWAFASTSVGGGVVSALNNYGCKAFTVATPTRYVRLIQSVTGKNGGVWSNVVAKRQAN